ncbi:MAG: gram-negative porin family protein [Ramlibacter sp.]|jgi:predicted porin|uniref:porin n=1 Tax=Ramlibacter sp. TaxID=1917967 RepID=UPI00261224FB|nr:porin [Ramlibacter sp.]MDB5749778.1 gram-negative porin family protein [Ramlibacter sp.]
MKKSLIALAVMAAAGAASAQSSVTLFGIVDATLQWGRGEVADRFQLGNSGYNSSRLGFRGTEDLGGGMSASFWLEAGMNNDNGTGGGSNTNNTAAGATVGQGLMFNRRSTVSLAGNWGELRLGRDYTPQFWNLTVFDPFGFNGVGTTQLASVGGVVGPTAVRASNAIGYFLPARLGGFYGQVQYYTGEQPSNAVNDEDGDGLGLRIGFAQGPFNVALGLSRTANAAGDITQHNLGGQWDFGMARVMAQYARDGNEGTNVDGRGWLIGALVPVGAGEIRVSYSRYLVEQAGPNPRTQKVALGYVHNLSKRTAVYTTIATVRNRGAVTALNGSTTGLGDSSSGLDIGIRHSF